MEDEVSPPPPYEVALEMTQIEQNNDEIAIDIEIEDTTTPVIENEHDTPKLDNDSEKKSKKKKKKSKEHNEGDDLSDSTPVSNGSHKEKKRKKKKKKADTIEPEAETREGRNAISFEETPRRRKKNKEKDSMTCERKTKKKSLKKSKSLESLDNSDFNESTLQDHRRSRSSGHLQLPNQGLGAQPAYLNQVYATNMNAMYGNMLPVAGPMGPQAVYYNAASQLAPQTYFNPMQMQAPVYGNYGVGIPPVYMNGIGAQTANNVSESAKEEMKREKAMQTLMYSFIFFFNIVLLIIIIFCLQSYTKTWETVVIEFFPINLGLLPKQAGFWLNGLGAVIVCILGFVLMNKEMSARLTLIYLGSLIFVIICIPWFLSGITSVQWNENNSVNSTSCKRLTHCRLIEEAIVKKDDKTKEYLEGIIAAKELCYSEIPYKGLDKFNLTKCPFKK
uniref:CSON007974 protein n=1 Tax=Culicoides sonorensis TaxID=179676 RepID=A0A336M2B3_CULSO